MIYNIRLFDNGFDRMTNSCWEAKSHRQALKEFAERVAWTNWTNAIVISKSGIGKRFDYKFRIIKEAPRFFQTIRNTKPAILVMLGSYAEIHVFDTFKARNEALKLCTTSDPVESVENDKEQTDITASSAETSDSENGLTSKKTLNGSAMNVTWMDALIQWNTVLNSTPAKNEDLGVLELFVGSSRSRSKHRQIFATLKKNDDKPGYKTVQVVRSGQWYVGDYGKKYGKRELDFRYAVLKIKDKLENLPGRMKKYAGKVAKMHTCSDHWNDGRNCWQVKFLEVPVLVKKGKLVGGEGTGLCITNEDLGDSLGKVMQFEYRQVSGNWKMMEGKTKYYVRPSWIDFRYRENENG